MLDDSTYWTKQRHQIVTWFNDNAPSFKDGYVAAVRMLHAPDFPARVQLVSHVVRDIYRFLPIALGGKALPRPGEVFPGMAKKLATSWKNFKPLIEKNATSCNDNNSCVIRMHPRICEEIIEIVKKSWEMAGDGKRQSSIGAAIASALFQHCHHDKNEFIPNWVIKSFDVEYDYFVGQAHLNKIPTGEGLCEHFEAFERAFHSLVGAYFMGKEELDTILQDANQDANMIPENQQLEVVLPRIRTSEFASYFFSRLQNPQWISPLENKGIFACPPPGIEVDGGVRHPYWPASKYLARMAEVAPQEVTDILVNITTDNSSVLRDILDAASKMPPEYAARLVPTICKAIEVDVFDDIYPKAIDFCVRMATCDGQEDSAMTLAESLFGLEHGSRKGTRRDREFYWYKEGLKKVVPVLTEKRPTTFINNLCQWLCTAIEREKNNGQENTSRHWRPAIEEHEQNRDYDFPGVIVGFVRQAFEQAIDKGPLTLNEGLAILKAQKFSVFERLRIHLINHFAEQAPELARSLMMEKTMLNSDEFKHEYAMLVGKRFPMLSQEDRDTWLSWVNDGPKRQNHIREWQFYRLHWIRDHLGGEWLEVYRKMFDEFGEPLLADLNSWHSSVLRGWKSPFTVKELDELSFDKALEKVDAWRPGQTRSFPDGPQQKGLADTFAQYVAAKAEEFSSKAEMLKGRQPIYVRTFIDKMTEAVNTAKVDVGAVLQLCTWVVEQPNDQDADADSGSWDLVDRGWQWTRESICRFLRTICELDSDGRLQYALSDLRETIGELLDSLTHSPAKSYAADGKERENPRVYDFLNSAIDLSRGEAVNALIAYARWVAKHVQQEEAGRKVVPDGFDAMPEVRKMLEWQITEKNASVESFAVIGAYLGLLHWIDPSWVVENAPRIFDLSKIECDPPQIEGWAAWNAFLVWGEPHLDLYRMLRPQYIYAVEHLSQAVLPPDAGRTPLQHLGEQLILLYGRGNLETCNDEQLLHRFLEEAPGDVRSQTIAFVGRSLSDSDNLPEAIVIRFQSLWDWYWPMFGQLDAKARPQDGLFSWWFTSKQFPDDWSLKQLEEFLEVLPIPDFADQITERLAELADAHIETVTRILDRMIRADNEGWSVYAWREPAKKILRSALQGGDTVRGMAVRLIDELGRRGYLEFGGLLL